MKAQFQPLVALDGIYMTDITLVKPLFLFVHLASVIVLLFILGVIVMCGGKVSDDDGPVQGWLKVLRTSIPKLKKKKLKPSKCTKT